MAAAWHLKRGSTMPKLFRWRDRRGPVDMTGKTLLVRLVDWEGTAIELSSSDPNVEILDQSGLTMGFFRITPTLEQREQLRRETPGRYYFTEIREDGTRNPFADGPLVIDTAGAP